MGRPVTRRSTSNEALRDRSAHLVPTPQQVRFLELRSHGLSLRQVAYHMDMSYDTAKTHSRRLNARLGALSTAHAVRLAFERGYLTPGVPPVGQVDVPEEDLEDEVDP